mmetsp:Transcript_8481/g.11174  ORF Transcript_8481/g.11174 Transcript_8481/m.11174 type:complete len:403 (+) Transcript_8481:239-1447(+)
MQTRSLILLASLAVSSAWLMPHRRVSTMRSLRATVENDAEVAVALKPEYEAAYSMICSQIKDQLPEKYKDSMYPSLSHFAKEYVTANQNCIDAIGKDKAELCRPDVVVNRFLIGIQLAMTLGMGPNKFQFQPFHKSCRGENPEKEGGNTIDLFKLGNDFFRPCIHMEKSVVLGQENIHTIMEQIKQGDNVVMLANHQSEADPQVVSCLMNELTEYGEEFEKMIFVAGHKVTTDALAVPFSMGRNLICIHSKKHIDADPDSKAARQKENMRAISGMLGAFKKGGTLLWVAPSGGRDRRNVETNDIPIAPFDSKAIDMFRLIGSKSKVPTHYYTMAMVTYDVCPPPDHVEAGVGELRNMRFTPVGINVGKACISVGGLESRHDFCDHAFEQCEKDYRAIWEAIK